MSTFVESTPQHRRQMNFLLSMSGLGGLLYGIDLGIIAGALPYLEATSGFTSNQLSVVVAAVLLGSVGSTLFAGLLSDAWGRRPVMIVSGFAFILSVPMMALSSSFFTLVLGRLFQGISAGLVGVVVPLYLAECLGATNRGKGTGVFQWLITLGIFTAALVAWLFSFQVEAIEQLQDAQRLFDFKNLAWRSIFWISLIPGLAFTVGSFFTSESPRWLFRQGRRAEAKAVLMKTRPEAQAESELQEMEALQGAPSKVEPQRESIFRRKYMVPFALACAILMGTQATGINSIIGYNTTLLIQSGLSDHDAHLGYVLMTLVNFMMTWVGVSLVDRLGRKFLLTVGASGLTLCLLVIGFLFDRVESKRLDGQAYVQSLVNPAQELHFDFTGVEADTLVQKIDPNRQDLLGKPSTAVIIYAYGDFRAASKVVRSQDPLAQIHVTRANVVPTNRVVAFFSSPFGDWEAGQRAPLKIEHALLTPTPSSSNGWATAILIFLFIGFFALGPGVCVWLALSELMPTRIRSNGMSMALLLNQAVSTLIALLFLPSVGQYGYGQVFFVFAGFSIVFTLIAAFWLPETKGKTLEEIETQFDPTP